MLHDQEYRERLGEVLEEIEGHCDFAEIRGEDDARFVFAKKDNRAIEIYQSEKTVIVELWENEEIQTEKEVDSYEGVTELILNWTTIKS